VGLFPFSTCNLFSKGDLLKFMIGKVISGLN
jgi:hypothetical protein